MRKRAVVSVVAAISSVLSGWGASLVELDLVPDGSVDPPGDRLELQFYLRPDESAVRLEARAVVISGANNDEVSAVSAAGDANRDREGKFLLVRQLGRNPGNRLMQENLIVRYQDLQLPPGHHQIAYEVRGVINERVAFARATRLTSLTVSERKRTTMIQKVTTHAVTSGVQKQAMFSVVDGKVIEKEAEIPKQIVVANTKELKVDVNIPGEYARSDERSSPIRGPYSLENERKSYENRPWKPEPKKLVYYATNRKSTSAPKPRDRYSAEQSGTLSFGVATVNIPVEQHRRGDLELPPWWNWWRKPDPVRFFMIDKLDEQLSTTFFHSVSNAFHTRKQDVLLFVHGYNNTFEFAVLRLAQLTHDIEFPGMPMLFSWPSQGKVTAYLADERMATNSVDALVAVLTELVATRKAHPDRKVHLVAHSMGNRVLLRALQMIRGQIAGDKPFGHVILTAPDIDAQEFVATVGSCFACADSVTLYFCDKDKALLASRGIHANKRVGEGIFCLAPLVNIGGDKLDTSWLSHDYFVSSDVLLIDLQMALVNRRSPDQRQTLRRKPPAGEVPPPGECDYYIFP